MSIMTLWQPILLSAVLAFIAGSVIWMIMPWHKSDWSKAPDEEGVRNALQCRCRNRLRLFCKPDPGA